MEHGPPREPRLTCVIVGAGERLGMSIAERFAREGFTVFALARRTQRLAAQVKLLQARRLDVIALTCDATSCASVDRALDHINAAGREIDVLIYNVALPVGRGPASLEPQLVREHVEASILGPIAFINRLLPGMCVRGGTVLFTACGVAHQHASQGAPHKIGQAGLKALIECMSADPAARRVRVGIVTIDGLIRRRTLFDPHRIAELYWRSFYMIGREHSLDMRYP